MERLSRGPHRLLLRTPALAPSQRAELEALLRGLPALLAAREREREARAEQTRLRLELRTVSERAARLEAHRSRASHDLRTPLVVMKGYVDMIQRGLAGPLSPALQRYADRLSRAVEEQNGLIARHLAPERGACTPLLPALRSGLARALAAGLPLHAPAGGVSVRATRAQVRLLARGLAQALHGVSGAALHVRGPEAAPGPCQLELRWPRGAALAQADTRRLSALAQALGGRLELWAEGLTLLLPAAG
ncbi:histidine kinase [Aggregicoccus sp. 17bor-14]|uniref:histidine kinase dimerization/phospho-acceptor domain-containing protein n=1 Tax=Myxococcaceae TaxID=31 RepID=UPI0012F2F67C|nr:histidine kinase [Aggregicoccus sp. 17bor-14]